MRPSPTARAALAAAALLAAVAQAGCSRSYDDEHYRRVSALCAGLVEARATVGDAVAAFGKPPSQEACEPAASLGEGDACTVAAPCAVRWVWPARDEGLCGGAGCSYGCELRFDDPALEGGSCAGQFLDAIPPARR
ncbi:MAG: hypothetical protein QM767_30415 [Anaeromyxobacter sp.]